jgi:hypothetical protein
MTVPHNEPCANDADAEVVETGFERQLVVEVEIKHGDTRGNEIRISKCKTRNEFKARNSNNGNGHVDNCFRFGDSDFEFVSDFEFRASDLPDKGGANLDDPHPIARRFFRPFVKLSITMFPRSSALQYAATPPDTAAICSTKLTSPR